MKYQLNNYNKFYIQLFLRKQKLFYLVFFDLSKQKTNLSLKQNLSKLEFNLIKIRNRFLKKIFVFSIFNSLIVLFESFFYFGFTKNKKLNLNLITNKSINSTIFAIVIENSIYLKKQLFKLKNISFLNNILKFFSFLINIVVIIKPLFSKLLQNRNNVI